MRSGTEPAVSRMLVRSRRAVAAAALAMVAAVLPMVPTAPAHAASFSGSLAQAVAAVPTAAEQNSGYDRSLFPHWVDANGDCQSTRAEVLISEAEPDAPITFTTSGSCTVATGRWFSYYDRVSWTAASDVDIDHMVPLAEAWGSGARGWSTSRRQAFANDLGDYRTLVGVTDNVNQSKSDQDPATWLPTYDKCRYVAEWVAVKIRWGLSADSAEKSVLNQYAASCSNTVSVTIA
ncbi:HNH endonuclease family protein [Nocardioides ferulae]|uniref:HNH endonuclease family protein n=1 Tax=Nocardioides ferulae TaxID=2340821 RepID=UPI001F0C5CB3|nr:HNH endonuclease family protein [Nocardioides ferulae]